MEAVASPLALQGPGTNGISPSALITIDPTLVVEYLASVVTIALGATRDELKSPDNLLSKENHADTVQRCSRFATDTQVAMYVQKDVKPSDDIPDGPVDNGTEASLHDTDVRGGTHANILVLQFQSRTHTQSRPKYLLPRRR